MTSFVFKNNQAKLYTNKAMVYQDPIMSSGLVLYLDPNNPNSFQSGNNTIYDLSGLNNHGTISNNVSLETNSIPLVNNTIEIPHHSSLVMTNTFTQFIWAKFNYTETSSYKTLFGKPSFSTYGLIIEWYGGNPILADCSTEYGRQALGNYNYIPNNVGEWSLIVQTYDSNLSGWNRHLYYCYNNQIFVLRSQASGTIEDYGYPVYIGDSGFSMNIGKAAIYNRVLSLSEIKKIYLTTKATYGVSNNLLDIKKVGCTIPDTPTYDPEAQINYGCVIYGCTDPFAINYDPNATIEDYSCQYE